MSALRHYAWLGDQLKKRKISKPVYDQKVTELRGKEVERLRIGKLIKEAKGIMINVAGKVENPLEWFQSERALTNPMSVAEVIIRDILLLYPIQHYREVSFMGLKLSEWGYARYDFYLPSINHIIEYNGKMAHSTPEQIAKDDLKDKFCRKHSINLTRYDNKDYYHLADRIDKLLQGYNIHKMQ